MVEPVAFSIPGEPVSWGRVVPMARVVMVKGRPTAVVKMVTPKKTRDAEKAVGNIAAGVMGGRPLITCPVRLVLVAVFAVPPSWPKSAKLAASSGMLPHTSTPDTDNIAKLVKDAINGRVYIDDSQVAELIVRKRYGYPERVDVTVTPIAVGMPASPAEKRRVAKLGPAELPAPPPLLL
jgi:Holliday junction resolvase RusA-like endonuclease